MTEQRPTTEELEERLQGFKDALFLCDYIDDWQSYNRCREINLDAIHKIKEEIARRSQEARPWRGALWPAGKGEDAS